MEPTVRPPVQPRVRAEDDRARPLAEARSWAPRDPEEPRVRPEHGAWIYTHNVERFATRAEPSVAAAEAAEPEPELKPAPRWMLAIAGAAIAALMGALLGGFMHI